MTEFGDSGKKNMSQEDAIIFSTTIDLINSGAINFKTGFGFIIASIETMSKEKKWAHGTAELLEQMICFKILNETSSPDPILPAAKQLKQLLDNRQDIKEWREIKIYPGNNKYPKLALTYKGEGHKRGLFNGNDCSITEMPK